MLHEYGWLHFLFYALKGRVNFEFLRINVNFLLF